MAERFGSLRRRWTAIGVLVVLSVIFFSADYIVRWQPHMGAVLLVRQQLQEQGEEEWFSGLVKEAECFPVRKSDSGLSPWKSLAGKMTTKKASQLPWCFEDGYGEGRSYGGARKHEGIDIMSVSGRRGELEVQSVSDGVVEQLGWLELGGYRVGVRSASGLYFYYAHLDSYAPGLKKGDKVRAGALLGYMGDTGYGSEGTRGQFPVHLHFGIYYNAGEEEKSLNPYSVLQLLNDDSEGGGS